MLNTTTAQELLRKIEEKHLHSLCYLAIPIPDGPGDKEIMDFLKDLKSMGFHSYVRTTEMGDEIVVTHKIIADEVEDGDAGPPRRQASPQFHHLGTSVCATNFPRRAGDGQVEVEEARRSATSVS